MALAVVLLGDEVASANASVLTTLLLTRISSDLPRLDANIISDAPTDVLAGKGFL